MKKLILIIILFLLVLVVLAFGKGWLVIERKVVDPRGEGNSTVSIKSNLNKKNTGYLAQYNFENLKERESEGLEIEEVGKVLVVEAARKEFVKRGDLVGKSFNFETQAISFESNGKKISGMMNLPYGYRYKKSPVIIMIRGFAESEGYFIGSGSWKAADELARNGFITVSLDFLGFGLSDNESIDILEARFEKPVSVLDLIESVKKLKWVDSERVGIWSHSNGGQIAISVLEVTSEYYPTVLWAPMTNPFPKSILETIDDSEGGKIVKERIKEFEKKYDSELYSIDNFYEWIEAPILIHQGSEDIWCKVEWQEDLRDELTNLGKDIGLDIREGNDHNLKQSWDEVINQDIEFFENKFKDR